MDNKEVLKAANEFLDAKIEFGEEWLEKANVLLPFCEDETENLYRTAARIIKEELERIKIEVEDIVKLPNFH